MDVDITEIIKTAVPILITPAGAALAWWTRGVRGRPLDAKRMDAISDRRDRAESQEEKAAWDALLERDRLDQLASYAKMKDGWRHLVRMLGITYGALFAVLAVAVAATQKEEGGDLYIVLLGLAVVSFGIGIYIPTQRDELRKHRQKRQSVLDKMIMEYAKAKPPTKLPEAEDEQVQPEGPLRRLFRA